MEKEEFARRMSQLRQAKGVSARDMSLSLGQSAGYINNIENKKSLPAMQSFFCSRYHKFFHPASLASFKNHCC